MAVSCLEFPNKGLGRREEEIVREKVSVDDGRKIWKEHMVKMMNVENEWSDSIDPSNTSMISPVLIFQGKGNPFNSNSYGGIKLLEHSSKLYEKILDGHLHEVVDIDKIQRGLMRGTVDAVWRLYSEARLSGPKIQSQKEKVFLVFVDLDNDFDWVPREVIHFPLRRKGVPEYLVDQVVSLYKGCKVAVSVDGELSSSFSVKVGVHQGSTLSPLLFVMVMDFLREDVRDGSLMELLYAGDLFWCKESLDEVMEKYGRWTNAVEGKGLRANVSKTKCMQSLFGRKSCVSRVDSCGICDEQVGCNSIQCTKCHRWIRGRCSDMARQVRLLSCRDVFYCRTYLGS